MNRLSQESSPYLLQHAHNPVHWWPWCDEAFEEASRRGVAVFLSIGYSTCYWCHVMERECFESPAIAALLNQKFVAIKVDREERPEVDDLYMAATVISTGHGGWPMSVFLDPVSRRPFWCGTYFPPSPSPLAPDRPSFPQVLSALSDAFAAQRTEIDEQSQAIAAAVAEQLSVVEPSAALDDSTLTTALETLVRMFDRNHGGFSSAPKFPQAVLLLLLLDTREAISNQATLQTIDVVLRKTLDGMLIGGIADHVAGGFHRYSVDGHWTVPHFEKMLYDNALLASAYARASKAFADAQYERVARRTLAWMDREMRTADGLFAAALDAEVNGREGASLVWTPADVQAAAGDLGEFAVRAYGLHLAPNFRDPHHPNEPAAHVLRLAGRPDEVCHGFGMSASDFVDRLDTANQRLLKVRNARPQPRRDTKAIAAWNGMALVALADAAAALNDPALKTQALDLARAIESALFNPDGSLKRSVTIIDNRPVAGPPATLEDYAWLSLGFTNAAALTPDPAIAANLHNTAKRCLDTIESTFRDKSGILFDVPDNRADLFVRPRTTHDGATPCGTSVAILAMFAHTQAHAASSTKALDTLVSISGAIAANPIGCANAVRGLLLALTQIPDAAPRLANAGPRAPRPVHAAQSSSVVEVLCADEAVILAADTPATLTLRINIASGWHLVAAEASNPAAFRIHVTGGQGVRVFADYPHGDEGLPGVEAGQRAYSGSLDIPIALERDDAPWSGTPLLAVRFQACNNESCLAPSTLELDIALNRA